MHLPAEAHVAVVDGERFLLMRNCGTAARPTLELLAEPAVEETNKSAGQHEHESAHRRGGEPHDRAAHAAGVADWLNARVLRHEIESLLVIGDPSTLGEMRRHYHQQTQSALVGELDRQLTGMPAPDILDAIQAA